MLVGPQYAELLLALEYIHHCMTCPRADRIRCLHVGVHPGGCVSISVSGSSDAGQAGEPERAAGSRRAVPSGELTRTSESLVAYPAVEMLQEALLVLHRQKQ
jgi:hypothetical protein